MVSISADASWPYFEKLDGEDFLVETRSILLSRINCLDLITDFNNKTCQEIPLNSERILPRSSAAAGRKDN